MIAPPKSKINDSLSALFSESTKIRVATDSSFNVLWQSRSPEDCPVAFYDVGKRSPENGMVCRVFVGNMCMSAECETINIDDEKLYMWTVHSAAELAAQINSISTYKDITFLFNTLKSNVDDLKQWITKRTKRFSEREKQLMICDAMTEQIVILERICAVMYDRRQQAVDIYRLIYGTAKSCNRLLYKKQHRVNILTMQEQTLKELFVCGEPFMLSSVLFSLMKRAVCFSREKRNMLYISHNEQSISISTKYTVTDPSQSGYITDEFELNSAKLYIEFIGGRLEFNRDGNGERIDVMLPLFEQDDTFNSTKTCLSRKELASLARVILAGV